MPDATAGRITTAREWPGRWETITRADYWRIIDDNGGLEALGVAASCTRPDDRNYVLTAWGRRDQHYPLVQNGMEGCVTTSAKDWEQCPGTHTFARFIYDPAMEDD